MSNAKLNELIKSTNNLMTCINKKCKNKQTASQDFMRKNLEPFIKEIKDAREKGKPVLSILRRMKKKTEELAKNKLVLDLQDCSASNCQEGNKRNIKNALEVYKDNCKEGDKKMCKMVKYSENILKKKIITGADIGRFTKMERLSL